MNVKRNRESDLSSPLNDAEIEDNNGENVPEVSDIERQLSVNEARYRSLVLTAAQIFWRVSADGKGREQPTWQAYTGQSKEEAKGYGWMDAVHPEDRENIRTARRSALKTKGLYETEYRLRRYDGVYRTFEVRGIPIFDKTGRIREWVGTSTDITERKQLESERALFLMREQQARAEAAAHTRELEAIFQSAVDALIVYDSQGRVQRVNAAARELFEIDKRPEAGASFVMRDKQGQRLLPERLPIKRILNGEVLRDVNAAEFVIDTVSRRDVEISVCGAPMRDDKGEIVGAVLIARDVTERRRLERRTHEVLSALLTMAQSLLLVPETVISGTEESSFDVNVVARNLAQLTCSVLGCQRVKIYVIDPHANVLLPLALVGFTPEQEQFAHEPLAFPLTPTFFPEHYTRLLKEDVFLFDMSQPGVDTYFSNPNGINNVLIVAMKVGEQLIGIVALDFGREVHEYTEQEIALARVTAKLTALIIERERLLQGRAEARAGELAQREANRRMDEFLGVVSHELRTPLTTINANIQLGARRLRKLASANPANADALTNKVGAIHELLERATHQVDVLNRLVSDLIDISRIRADKLELQMRPAPGDLAEIVREVVENERGMFPERNIYLSLPSSETRPLAPVYIDSDRIGQVVSNYLTNALKYSAADQPVEVEVEVEGSMARVSVRDAGPGLSPVEQTKVWERFYRVKGIEIQTGVGVGLGLGLHISRTIIEHHKGQVGVESQPGIGSTFWFTLPLAENRL